jgi:hypothetical protein
MRTPHRQRHRPEDSEIGAWLALMMGQSDGTARHAAAPLEGPLDQSFLSGAADRMITGWSHESAQSSCAAHPAYGAAQNARGLTLPAGFITPMYTGAVSLVELDCVLWLPRAGM